MNIGIYGGSFDPPHIGHLILAECAREALSLDRVLFVPAWVSPFKEGETRLPAGLRAEMVQLAISGNNHFDGEYWEVHREQVSYTIDTLRHIRKHHPGDSLYLLMGSDTYRDFPAWKEPEEIISLVTLAVAQRPGHQAPLDLHRFGTAAVTFNMPLVDVSSSDIRSRVRDGRSIQYLVPWTVKTFIEAQELYRAG